jgi:outer membrane biosynthesis protein TonB
MKNLFNVINLSKAIALISILSFTACNSASTDETEKIKGSLNNQNNPSTVPGTSESTADNNGSSVTATNASDPNKASDPSTATTMVFEKEMHDFGSVKDGDKVSHVFKFKNTGDKPLIISDAKGSCGCTVPSYPKEPIAPGKSGEIKVEFNSAGKKGSETKYVTLNANTIPAETRLTVKANVIAKDVKTN